MAAAEQNYKEFQSLYRFNKMSSYVEGGQCLWSAEPGMEM